MHFLRRVVCAGVLGCVVWMGRPALAAGQDAPICPICKTLKEDSVTYGEKAGNTLARGVLNFTLGWTELIRQPAKKARAGDNVWRGIANGIGKSALRTARGLGEVVTFWTPKRKDGYIHFSKDCPIDTMN